MEIHNEGSYHLECGHYVLAEDDAGILVGGEFTCLHCWKISRATAYISPVFTFGTGELDQLFGLPGNT